MTQDNGTLQPARGTVGQAVRDSLARLGLDADVDKVIRDVRKTYRLRVERHNVRSEMKRKLREQGGQPTPSPTPRPAPAQPLPTTTALAKAVRELSLVYGVKAVLEEGRRVEEEAMTLLNGAKGMAR